MTEPKPSPAVPIKGGRFLIVGGASLVGSATAEAMLKGEAASVVVFDNFSQGTPEALRHIEADPRLRVVSGDILRLAQVLDALDGIDGVVHLAAMMTIAFDSDPRRGIDVNIIGAANVVEACRLKQIRKLVFASSNAVYGYGPGVVGDLVEATPFHTAGAPPAAVLYGASKIVGEQLCRDAYRRHGLNYVVLRYSTVYGERQHYRAANAVLIMDAHDRVRAGQPPRVVGDGSEAKHFVYVGDVARANIAALESTATDVAVNLSGPAPTTTGEIARLVIELSGAKMAPQHVEPEAGKVRLTSGGAWRIDHALAEKTIGWRPEVDMREGIRRLIAWRDAQGR